jgi:hypothetical protein
MLDKSSTILAKVINMLFKSNIFVNFFLVPSVAEKRVLKSSTMTRDFAVSPFNCVHFVLCIFEILLLDTYSLLCLLYEETPFSLLNVSLSLELLRVWKSILYINIAGLPSMLGTCVAFFLSTWLLSTFNTHSESK